MFANVWSSLLEAVDFEDRVRARVACSLRPNLRSRELKNNLVYAVRTCTNANKLNQKHFRALGYTNNIDVKLIKGYLAIMFNNTDLFFAFCKVSFNKSQDANGHWFTSGILF